jgi:acetolactate decarboxylase
MKRFALLLLGWLMCDASNGQPPVSWVLDTDFSKGRLTHVQTITLDDLVRFHGHRCDGLVVGYLGLREALHRLYPDYLVDRTNTRIVSRSSPCLTDAAVYLTGGRYQYNTFFVSDTLRYLFMVQRIDNGQAFGVNLKPGIKPAAIDTLGQLAAQGLLDACALDSLQRLEDAFMEALIALDPRDVFVLTPLPEAPWAPRLDGTFRKTDIVNKALEACPESAH